MTVHILKRTSQILKERHTISLTVSDSKKGETVPTLMSVKTSYILFYTELVQ